MAGMVSAIQNEIQRIVRRETRKAVADLQKQNKQLQRQVDALEKRVSQAASSGPVRAPSPRAAGVGVRYTSESLRGLRTRLGLSQREMALLVGVSAQAVYLWESKGGALRLRNSTRKRLQQITGMTKRQLTNELAKAEDAAE